MLATAALLVLAAVFFAAVSRSGTPREARRPLRSLTGRDHLVAAWVGVVLLTRSAERSRTVPADGPCAPTGPPSRPPACRHGDEWC